MFVESLLIIACLLLIVLLFKRQHEMRKRALMGLDGPPTMLLLGNLHQIGAIMDKNGERLYGVFEQWKEKYGKLYGFYMGPRLFVIIENLDMVRQILVTQFACFTDRMEMNFLSESLSSSIVNAKGAEWRSMRACLSPTFTGSKMRSMSQTVQSKLDTFISNVRRQADVGACFDVFRLYKALTLDVIAQCAFSFSSDCQRDVHDPFLVHSKNFFEELPSPERCLLMKLSVLFPELASICSDLHFAVSTCGRSESWLFAQLVSIIEQRTEKPDTIKMHNDVIKLLLNPDENNNTWVTRPKLNSQQIANNCFAFLLAGYETTSTALACATWLLAKHDDCQQRLADEEYVDWYDTVMNLPYMDAVFHESLRLFPPITFFVNRTCVKKCQLEGINLEPGTQVGIPIWNIHRDSEIWHEPDNFDPERFTKQRHRPMSWLPFGAGPRKCIGQRFAEMEFKLSLARLLIDFTLHFGSSSQDPLPIQNKTAMLTIDAVNICVRGRLRDNESTK